MNVIVLYVMNADRSTIGAQTPSAQVLMDGQLMSKEPPIDLDKYRMFTEHPRVQNR